MGGSMKNAKQKARTASYDDGLLEDLKDPEFVAMYLNACIEGRSDEDFEIFWDALQNVIKAYGVTDLANEAGITRDTLYKSFTGHKNPTIKSFRKILNALNLDIAIVPKGSLA
jgi:probable addiction module antidote protein